MSGMWIRVLAFQALICVGGAQAQSVHWPMTVLTGLERLRVEVIPVSADIAKESVEETVLQADVELILRRVGIRVIPPREAAPPDVPLLRLTLSDVVRGDVGGEFHEFQFNAVLWQDVTLSRVPSAHALVPTWTYGSDGVHLSGTLAPSVRDAVRRVMTHFVDNFLEVNPYKNKAQPKAGLPIASAKRSPEN